MVRPEIQFRVTIAAVVFGLLLAAALLVACVALIGNNHAPVGVVLIYSVDRSDAQRTQSAVMDSLVKQLNGRLRSLGHARALNSQQLEAGVYGNPRPAEVESIKRLIGGMGQLEFRILADSTMSNDRPIIALAQLSGGTPHSQDVFQNNTKVAEWVECGPAEKNSVDQAASGLVIRESNGVPEVLVLMDSTDVTGEYLTLARKSFDEQNGPAIHFSLNQEGAGRLSLLTSQNLPNMGAPNMRRRLGVILDKRLLSAPIIQSRIADQAMISGGSMPDREVDDIVNILNSGTLPCSIHLVDQKRVGEE